MRFKKVHLTLLVIEKEYTESKDQISNLILQLFNNRQFVNKAEIQELINFYEEVSRVYLQQKIFDDNFLGQSPRGFATAAMEARAGYIVATPQTPGNASGFFNSSITDELLNMSNMSFSQFGDGKETFDRFFVKFGIFANEIERAHRCHPEAINRQLVDKLALIKRDLGILSIHLRTLDSRSAEKRADLEGINDKLTSEVARLKEEVSSLLALNSDMNQRLIELGQSGSPTLNMTQQSIPGKVNASVLFATEDKAEALLSANKELKSQVDTLKKEKKSYFSQAEWLRTNLDDHLKKFNELLSEKLKLQEMLNDILSEDSEGEKLYDKWKKLQQNEVTEVYIESLLGQNQRFGG